tara:strand:- start:55 stop:357 length:303 start_codon:yes stop_codon:yes gene_type:complete
MIPIKNCTQLVWEWVGWKADSEDQAKALAEKWVFKGTECGCVFSADSEGIRTAGYAEGSDAELPSYPLPWGFTIDEFNCVLTLADKDGVAEWEECNEDWD